MTKLFIGAGAYGALVVPAKFAIEPAAKYVLLEAAFGALHYAAAGIALALVFRMA